MNICPKEDPTNLNMQGVLTIRVMSSNKCYAKKCSSHALKQSDIRQVSKRHEETMGLFGTFHSKAGAMYTSSPHLKAPNQDPPGF